MKKLMISMFLVIGVLFTAQAQNDKINETAKEKVEELNAEIIAGDPSLALSEEQKAQITQLHVQRITEARKLRKDNADKEDIKASNKKYFEQIFQEVLTKEQKKARRKGKDD